MHRLVVLGRRLPQQLRDPHAEDLGEPVQQQDCRGLQPALDLRQIVLGDSGQPGYDGLGLAFGLPVEPQPLTDPAP